MKCRVMAEAGKSASPPCAAAETSITLFFKLTTNLSENTVDFASSGSTMGRGSCYKTLNHFHPCFATSQTMRDEKRNGAMLRIETQRLGNISTFRCTGRIIGRDGQTLWNTVSQSCARAVVLDLANVRAIDAGGLGTLVSLRMWAQASGTTLKLMNLTPFVEQILELTQLRGMFEVCSVPENARPAVSCSCSNTATKPGDVSNASVLHPPNFRAFRPVKAPDSVLQNS